MNFFNWVLLTVYLGLGFYVTELKHKTLENKSMMAITRYDPSRLHKPYQSFSFFINKLLMAIFWPLSLLRDVIDDIYGGPRL